MDRDPIVRKAKKTTLEDIIQRKCEILEGIRVQKDVVAYSGSRIFSFNSNELENTGIVKKVNTGIAIFDGILIGYKIFKKICRLFK